MGRAVTRLSFLWLLAIGEVDRYTEVNDDLANVEGVAAAFCPLYNCWRHRQGLDTVVHNTLVNLQEERRLELSCI